MSFTSIKVIYISGTVIVNYNYLPQEFKNTKKIFFEWKKLIRSSDFTLGFYVKKFEQEFAKYIKVKYCISTNNGTDALILCLKSLGIKNGDEVITPCNSFYATAGAIVAVGAKPVFCDVDNRYQIDVKKIQQLITKQTKAILPVHWAGASPDMKEIIRIAKKNKIFVVEDACMGIGATINGKSAGSFGEVNAFSMHPLKSLNVMGDAGVLATNNRKIFNWAKKYRNHGMVNRDNIDIWGVNNRMQPLQAIVAIQGLKNLKKVLSKRKKNADYLDQKLKKLNKFIYVPKRLKNYAETYSLYMILCKNRNKLKRYLEEKKIEAKIHYPKPLHIQKASKKINIKISLKNAERQSRELLTLPVHQFLNKKHLDHMINTMSNFYLKSK
jgi:aminotransferase EvaB